MHYSLLLIRLVSDNLLFYSSQGYCMNEFLLRLLFLAWYVLMQCCERGMRNSVGFSIQSDVVNRCLHQGLVFCRWAIHFIDLQWLSKGQTLCSSLEVQSIHTSRHWLQAESANISGQALSFFCEIYSDSKATVQ